ncbi:hypothetical protein LJC26_09125, partial [Desulfovibrio sp. OttesenSCG-928-O18]|nr:hypothetical protein [Desulfovibrio sp. OttesenSCG-928-O18]
GVLVIAGPGGTVTEYGFDATPGATNTHSITINGQTAEMTVSMDGDKVKFEIVADDHLDSSIEGVISYKPSIDSSAQFSDTDLANAIEYEVSVTNPNHGSTAEFNGKGTVVVDAVADLGDVNKDMAADYTPDIANDGREFALPGEKVTVSGSAQVHDLDGSEVPFLMFNVPSHWQTGLSLISKADVMGEVRTEGGDAIPDASFSNISPRSGLDTTDEYLLLKLEPAPEGQTAWTFTGGKATQVGDVITYEFDCGAKVTFDTKTGDVDYELTFSAPAVEDIPPANMDSLKETLYVKVITVEQAEEGVPHELDYGNNVAVSDFDSATLEVRGEVRVNLLVTDPNHTVADGGSASINESDAHTSITWTLALTQADGSEFDKPLFSELTVTINLHNFGTSGATFGEDFTFDWPSLQTALDAQGLTYDYNPATGALEITFPVGYNPDNLANLELNYTVTNDHLTEGFDSAKAILTDVGLAYTSGTAVLDVTEAQAQALQKAIEAKYAGVHGDNSQHGLQSTETFGPEIGDATGTGYKNIDKVENVDIKDGTYNNLDSDPDNDGYTVSITAAGRDVMEGSDATFTINLTNDDGQPAVTDQDTILILKLSGSGDDDHKATIGGAESDVAGNGYIVVVIPAGQSSATVTVPTVADQRTEGTASDPYESFEVSIEGAYGNEITIEPGKGTAGMNIMEPGTTYVWLEAVSQASVKEGTDTTVTFTLMFSKNDLGDHGGKIFVSLTGSDGSGHGAGYGDHAAHGAATPGVDFTVAGGEYHNGEYGVW